MKQRGHNTLAVVLLHKHIEYVQIMCRKKKHLLWMVHNKDSQKEKEVLEVFPPSQNRVVGFSFSFCEFVQECICNSKNVDENVERLKPNLSFSKSRGLKRTAKLENHRTTTRCIRSFMVNKLLLQKTLSGMQKGLYERSGIFQ